MKMGSVIVESGKKVLTMTEYIEREAISEEIRKYYYKNPPNFSYGEGFDRSLDRAQRAILDAPAADVAELVHWQWVDNGIQDSILNGCSVCGFTCGSSSFFYCPNCGAKMDGRDGNSDICSKTT